MARRTEEPIAAAVVRTRIVAELVAFAVVAVLTAWSAVIVKESAHATPLMEVERVATREPARIAPPAPVTRVAFEPAPDDNPSAGSTATYPVGTRWFNGRPIRAARTIWMTVTAYSPDHRSCGIFADGQTATLHSVWTNGMKLVAADTRVLPFGSMISVPGYASGDVVPVLDRGGKIRGHRLDLLFPTHAAALQWGVRKLPVVVYEYADGQPAPNPRKER